MPNLKNIWCPILYP